MSFSLESTKPTHKVVLDQKKYNIHYLVIIFNRLYSISQASRINNRLKTKSS